jgi:hypothetical protein
VFTVGYEQIEMLKGHVVAEYEKAMETFGEAPEEDRDFLKMFSFICFLSFDVYMKKSMIEQLIDELDGQMKADKDKDSNKDNKGKEK